MWDGTTGTPGPRLGVRAWTGPQTQLLYRSHRGRAGIALQLPLFVITVRNQFHHLLSGFYTLTFPFPSTFLLYLLDNRA